MSSKFFLIISLSLFVVLSFSLDTETRELSIQQLEERKKADEERKKAREKLTFASPKLGCNQLLSQCSLGDWHQE